MRELDPNGTMKRRELGQAGTGSAGFGLVGLLTGLAIAVIAGILFWNTGDRRSMPAVNARTDVSLGRAPSAPPPPPFDKDDPQIRKEKFEPAFGNAQTY